MIDKNTYLGLKRYIKTLCLDEIKEIADNMDLTSYEYQLLYNLNQDNGRVKTCLELNICERKYTKDLRLTLTKVYRYMKRTGSINF